jgi:hypothetical protein
MVTIDDVRAFALRLPRTTEALVRDRVKFRVGRIVYLAFSRDETVMGFAFPKEERDALVRSEPDRFLMPSGGDLRYHWVLVRLVAIDRAEMRSSSWTRGGWSSRRRWPPHSTAGPSALNGRVRPRRTAPASAPAASAP